MSPVTPHSAKLRWRADVRGSGDGDEKVKGGREGGRERGAYAILHLTAALIHLLVTFSL